LRDEYLCFPNSNETVTSVAKAISATSVPASFGDGFARVEISINEKQVNAIFFDTGSDITSLPVVDLQMVGLSKPIRVEHRTAYTNDGAYNRKLFGPAKTRWPGTGPEFSNQLETISESPSPIHRKIGNDILHSLIVGLDSKTKMIWIAR
jgi:hypothetical protein